MGSVLFSQFSYERLVLIVLMSALLMVILSRPKKSPASRYLACYFFFVIIFNIGHLITYSLMSPAGAVGWYLAAIAPFGLVALVQFAYHFPRNVFARESRAFGILSIVLSALAFVEYVWVARMQPIVLSETGYGSRYESPWIAPLAVALFLWAFIVFMRQAIALEGASISKPADWFKSLWKMHNADARKARYFAIVVLLELVNTITIALYMSVRFIPYSTLLTVNNTVFLAIYVLYVVIFITGEVEPLSFRFKITGLTFILVLSIVAITGSLGLYQFEDAYDTTNRAEMRYVRSLIEKKNFAELPDYIDGIIVADSPHKTLLLYSKDARLVIQEPFVVWEFIPGSIALSSRRYDFSSEESLEEGRRYFTRVGEMNQHVYVVNMPPRRYGILYNYVHYRELLHQKVLRTIVLLLAALAAVLVIMPFLVKMGLLRPLDAILGNVGKKDNGNREDELVLVSRSFEEMMREKKALSEENIRLKEETKKKKRPDYAITGPGRDKIARAISYVNENYRFDISREGLAASVSMSPVRFGKAFRAYTGKKLGDYINELRLRDAKQLLEAGEMPISEIAFEVGFESLRSFNRVFYKHTGMTPTDYRTNALMK